MVFTEKESWLLSLTTNVGKRISERRGYKK